MRIALIDDNRAQAETLLEMIRAELSGSGYPESSIDIFENGRAFLSRWQAGAYDIIILDILMDQPNGIETARQIRGTDSLVRLAFSTSSNEFASESYEVNAQYYLLKPPSKESVAAMLRRLDPESFERTQTLTLPDGRLILPRRILYTEYCNHVVTLYLKGAEPCRVRISQAGLENLLLPYKYLFSPVKGIILNFHEVLKMTGENFLLSSGQSIHITRRKYREAKEAYTRFRFEQMRKEVESECRPVIES